ncbi:UNVERIFIED_CONTAM: putative mitochondrial protein [Sesamum angustifolium]|uniref:Mitochondrial protein n=1 Tax=Sesamum angustifolium TaxID=2727405 RepID=A0AAW2IL18_9LAMI
MIANLWWHSGEARKIHWISWQRMCLSKVQGGLGFRDLQAFNLGMLAKQVWRILSFPDSLLSKVLQAKFFPEGKVLSATCGRNPSFTWRSIHAAIGIVRGGFRWRICSGRSVQVWQDPWLPGLTPFVFFLLQLQILSICGFVILLMLPLGREWNHSMVRALFCRDEAESILAIPLSCADGEDFFVWHRTADGKFSVRSAYHVAVSLANQSQPSPSSFESFLWKTIWKANVPGKIRIFIWKLAKNALPTCMNLRKKLRADGWGCPFCGSEQEDIEHAFLRCSFVRQIWALSNLQWSLISAFPADPCAWVERMARSLSPGDFAFFISICWAVWWNRNRALMEHASLSAGDLLSFVSNYLASFHQVNTSPVRIVSKSIPTSWSPPELGEVKLNFDRALFAPSSEVGLGVIARDAAGACIWWKSVCKQGMYEPEMVEAFAAREAILLALRFGWRRIIIEGDSANLLLKLSEPSPDCSVLGPIVRDIKLLAFGFDQCLFSLVRRSGNKIAHCLARRASVFASEGSCVSPELAKLLFLEHD